ncbi:MAG: 16S rRNA (cytidine(1402)-2'-O)-methyltransferase [Magnetococcales bacterium]|nr:16S rRNA (cytidine(1402)-2'-O)-methyltransferase [Magnetococcales bacterium]
MKGTGRLYIVPTPIGNLEDMTLRGVRVLREVERILAEDTRRTRILCDHYGVTTPVSRFDDNTAAKLLSGVLADLAAGRRIALVSDAGTPGISDPGPLLARAARDLGVAVEALPGATSVTTALSGSGFPGERFVFEGFLPRKGGERQRRLRGMTAEARTVIFFESPQRLAATLDDLAALGAGSRAIVVARELTKLHETLHRGTVAELAAFFHQQAARGEIVVVMEPGTRPLPAPEEVPVLLDEALASGMSLRDASRHLAPLTGLSASTLYGMGLERRKGEVDATRSGGER